MFCRDQKRDMTDAEEIWIKKELQLTLIQQINAEYKRVIKK